MKFKAYCPACLEQDGRLAALSPIMGCQDESHPANYFEISEGREWPKLRGILIAPSSQSKLRRYLPNSNHEKWDFLPLADLNIMFGPNGSGKTSFLRLLWAAMSLDCSEVEGFVFEAGHKIRESLSTSNELGFSSSSKLSLGNVVNPIAVDRWAEEGLVLVTASTSQTEFDLFSFSDRMQSPRNIYYIPVIKKNAQNTDLFILEAHGVDPISSESSLNSLQQTDGEAPFSSPNNLDETCPFWFLPGIVDTVEISDYEDALAGDVGNAREHNYLKTELISCFWDFDFPTIYDFSMPESEEFLPRGAEGIGLRTNLAIFCRSFSEDERQEYLDELASTAGRIFPSIRSLEVEQGDLFEVSTGSHPRLIVNGAFDDSGLSRAQSRIIALLVHSMVATYRPGYRTILVDDIELGLNRQAESSLARLLPELTGGEGESRGVIQNRLMFISTQSPEIMLSRNANVLLFSEGEVRQLGHLSGDLSKFGLRPVDVFGSLAAFVVVEGEHDQAVIEALDPDGSSLERISIIKGRGAKNFPGIFDSQILFKFTQAPILVVVDNFRHKAAARIVREYSQLTPNVPNVAALKASLSKLLPQRQGGENRFIGDLLLNAFEHEQLGRLTIFGLSKADITMYLPESAFELPESWESMHVLYKQEKSDKSFKDWLRDKHGIRINTPKISATARKISEWHPDILRLLDAIKDY